MTHAALHIAQVAAVLGSRERWSVDRRSTQTYDSLLQGHPEERERQDISEQRSWGYRRLDLRPANVPSNVGVLERLYLNDNSETLN